MKKTEEDIYGEYSVRRKGDTPIRFRGRIIGSAEENKPDANDYYGRVTIYRSKGGKYIVEDGLIGALYHALHRPGAAGMVQSARLANRLANRYHVALIDESQDTDPRQFAIFKRIFLDAEYRRYLILVGDPKQAIYGFRGADLSTYLAARSAADTSYTLSQTYRAPEALVDTVNLLFDRGRSFHHPDMVFVPAESALKYDRRLLRDGIPCSRLETWIVPDEDNAAYSAKWRRIPALSARIASTIVDLLHRAELLTTFHDGRVQKDRVTPSDFAVLVATNEQAYAMAAALQVLGVPAVVNSGADVFSSDEARELHTLLQALTEFHRTRRLRSALSSSSAPLPRRSSPLPQGPRSHGCPYQGRVVGVSAGHRNRRNTRGPPHQSAACDARRSRCPVCHRIMRHPMSLWTSPETWPPEIDLLVRRWKLPDSRIANVKQLLADQADGGTASILPADTPTDFNWGAACQFVPEGLTPGGEAAIGVAPTPLVLRQYARNRYLQTWRFFSAEQTIARELLTRANTKTPKLTRSVAELLSDLGADPINDQQAQAITCALEHSLAIITGVPGSGKTYTLARLLALLIKATPGNCPTIRLAAPTGKAAERLKETVEKTAEELPSSLGAEIKAALKKAAAGASTLHNLLGFNPGTGRCRYDSDVPLSCDVLIVDECSMVDTLMWQALLTALQPSTRLVLVGDPHQLESVAAGDVLGSLVRFAQEQPNGPLSKVWVHLTESLRFRNRSGIGALALAVVNYRPDAAVRLLASHPSTLDDTYPADGLAWSGDQTGHFYWECLPGPVRLAITAVADAPTPAEALNALTHVRILTAHREHTMGAVGLNETIQRHLSLRPGSHRAPNQPIIINQNDPETKLTNGSVGILMEQNGTLAAFFPSGSADIAPRRIPLRRLPDHSPAWALTIHRSQGSEFDQVVVILPNDESPLATRELIYTGITRARECVHVWGAEATVRKALDERVLRCTLLEASLQGTLHECKNPGKSNSPA